VQLAFTTPETLVADGAFSLGSACVSFGTPFWSALLPAVALPRSDAEVGPGSLELPAEQPLRKKAKGPASPTTKWSKKLHRMP
jgi:hypothetical protein